MSRSSITRCDDDDTWTECRAGLALSFAPSSCQTPPNNPVVNFWVSTSMVTDASLYKKTPGSTKILSRALSVLSNTLP